jgi:hypothetical protein
VLLRLEILIAMVLLHHKEQLGGIAIFELEQSFGLVHSLTVLLPAFFYPSGGPPCAALERREFLKVTLSNLFYLSLEVGREKVNMIFA